MRLSHGTRTDEPPPVCQQRVRGRRGECGRRRAGGGWRRNGWGGGCASLSKRGGTARKWGLPRVGSTASTRCEDPRPHVWSMCAACFCPCISLSLATPLGRSRYQTSEFPTKSPTHTGRETGSSGKGLPTSWEEAGSHGQVRATGRRQEARAWGGGTRQRAVPGKKITSGGAS